MMGKEAWILPKHNFISISDIDVLLTTRLVVESAKKRRQFVMNQQYASSTEELIFSTCI
jgi:hypothetical protein